MGGYSSDDSGSPSGGGTKKQAKSFAKKNKTPVKDFIASGGVTGAVIRGVKKAIKHQKTKNRKSKSSYICLSYPKIAEQWNKISQLLTLHRLRLFRSVFRPVPLFRSHPRR